MKTCKNEQTILCYISKYPGTHISKIVRELRLSYGTVIYHTRKLERKELIKHRYEGLKKCFFPFTHLYRPIKLTAHQQKIISIIEKNPHISEKRIAAIQGVTRQAVNYHTKNLSLQGLIRSIKENKQKLWIVADKTDP